MSLFGRPGLSRTMLAEVDAQTEFLTRFRRDATVVDTGEAVVGGDPGTPAGGVAADALVFRAHLWPAAVQGLGALECPAVEHPVVIATGRDAVAEASVGKLGGEAWRRWLACGGLPLPDGKFRQCFEMQLVAFKGGHLWALAGLVTDEDFRNVQPLLVEKQVLVDAAVSDGCPYLVTIRNAMDAEAGPLEYMVCQFQSGTEARPGTTTNPDSRVLRGVSTVSVPAGCRLALFSSGGGILLATGQDQQVEDQQQDVDHMPAHWPWMQILVRHRNLLFDGMVALLHAGIVTADRRSLPSVA